MKEVPIDVEVAAKWAAERSLRFNGESRSSYVLDLLQEGGRRTASVRRSNESRGERKLSNRGVVEQVDAADEVRATVGRRRGPRS